MDKIDFARLDDHFGTVEQSMVYAGSRYSDLEIRFSEPSLASGALKLVTLPGMSFTEISLDSPGQSLSFDNGQSESVESAFVLQGGVESHFHNLSKPVQFGTRSHNLQYNTNFSAEHIIHSPSFQAFSITYEMSFIHGLLQGNETGALAHLSKSLEKGEHFLGAPESVHLHARIEEVIRAMQHCPFQGATRYVYLESKMMELFVLQVEQLQQWRLVSSRQAWSRSDVDKLQAVRTYIEEAYLEPLSLATIAQRFLLNEYKLKRGYKHLFETTVFGHISHLRMQKAKQLLLDRQMNITEVAFFIGYQDLSSFSAAFKKHFGYSPGKS